MTAIDLLTLRNLVLVALVLAGVFFALRRGWPARPPGAPLNLGDCILYGANLIVDGFEYFPDWSAAMQREFAGIDTQLNPIYTAAQKLADIPKYEWKDAASELAEEIAPTVTQDH